MWYSHVTNVTLIFNLKWKHWENHPWSNGKGKKMSIENCRIVFYQTKDYESKGKKLSLTDGWILVIIELLQMSTRNSF